MMMLGVLGVLAYRRTGPAFDQRRREPDTTEIHLE
jgi:hypothetical protein